MLLDRHHIPLITDHADRPCSQVIMGCGSHNETIANDKQQLTNGGGADGTRTRDPRTASAVRYQLRYSPDGITTDPARGA
jgi:hypothetical protein